MRFLKFIIPLFMAAIILGGCRKTEEDPVSDYSFISQQPCGAPCWYGLKLDISGQEEILQTIKNLPFVVPESVRVLGTAWENDQTAKFIIFDCLHPQEKSCGSMTISQNKLKKIYLTTTYSLSIEKVVEIYGPPDLITFGMFHPETGGCNLGLFWPDKEITVSSTSMYDDQICKQLGKTGKLPANIQVTDVMFIVKERLRSQEGLPWPGFLSDMDKK